MILMIEFTNLLMSVMSDNSEQQAKQWNIGIYGMHSLLKVAVYWHIAINNRSIAYNNHKQLFGKQIHSPLHHNNVLFSAADHCCHLVDFDGIFMTNLQAPLLKLLSAIIVLFPHIQVSLSMH